MLLLHGLIEIGQHGRLENQELYTLQMRPFFLFHKVNYSFDHGIGNGRRTDPTLT